jgi:hypothetical protein
MIVPNVRDPTEDKTDDVRDSFDKELEHVFDKFPKYVSYEILLGDFNAKVGKEEILNRQPGIKVYIQLVMIMQLR